MPIAIIDYGMGNLRSIYNAFEAINASPVVVHEPKMLEVADGIVLPGVGAFGVGMDHLRDQGWRDRLDLEVIKRKKPFLGICLGMQLIATYSMEHGRHEGLNWISGGVERLEKTSPDIRLPHVGWNDAVIRSGSRLLAGLGQKGCFYFVHSFGVKPDDDNVVSSTCNYGSSFAATIESGNIMATQFHPEKSHHSGLHVLRNFMQLVSTC